MMNVVEKNIGEKIDYTVDGTMLNLNGELILDLSRYERDHEVHLDVSENEYRMLTMGLSRKYIAQIDIAERQYKDTEGTDSEGEKTITKESVPFSIDNVTLTLWAIKGGNA